MPKRSYNHSCDVARALDVVGGRWALLVIRELLAGPRRFTELRTALPGVATNVLAVRLKELEAHGVIRRTSTPEDGRAQVYELTALGKRVQPAVEALASWGAAVTTWRSSSPGASPRRQAAGSPPGAGEERERPARTSPLRRGSAAA